MLIYSIRNSEADHPWHIGQNYPILNHFDFIKTQPHIQYYIEKSKFFKYGSSSIAYHKRNAKKMLSLLRAAFKGIFIILHKRYTNDIKQRATDFLKIS